MSISLAIIGASGKMGKHVLSLALSSNEFTLASVCVKNDLNEREWKQLLAKSPKPVFIHNSPEKSLQEADVAIDFSSPASTSATIVAAVKMNRPLIIGTTGLGSVVEEEIKQASRKIPILYSPNFSLGIALCLEVAQFLAKHLKGKASIEIIETHHVSKKDSPSGTAIALAKKMDEKESTIQSIRLGQAIGEHRIIFSCEGERMELKHEALSRDAFAKGALIAAKFIYKKAPGLYTIQDLLSL